MKECEGSVKDKDGAVAVNSADATRKLALCFAIRCKFDPCGEQNAVTQPHNFPRDNDMNEYSCQSQVKHSAPYTAVMSTA